MQPCYGEYKATALRELAAANGIDLAQSTAYSDSHTDLAFLEAVGHPVAVNPDSKLRAIAERRGWPVLTFVDRLSPGQAVQWRRRVLAGLWPDRS